MACRVLRLGKKKAPLFVKSGANHPKETHVDAQSTFFIVGIPASFFSPRILYFHSCFARARCALAIA